MKKISIITGSIAGAALLAALPLAAFADTNASANVGLHLDGDSGVKSGIVAKLDGHLNDHMNSTGVVITSTSTLGVRTLAGAIAQADKEIARRIANLNALLSRVGQMKNISSTELASLQASINAQISALNTLKVKIDADTDLVTVKTDLQSITKDYRIYMVVLPQSRIVAAADRVETIVSDMQALAPKLQARITAAAAAGHDMTAANAAYTDMNLKVSDANVQATAAASEVANLQPDNGVASVQASNKAAINDAQAKLKVATNDLKAARADVNVILKAVKGTGSVTASTTVSH